MFVNLFREHKESIGPVTLVVNQNLTTVNIQNKSISMDMNSTLDLDRRLDINEYSDGREIFSVPKYTGSSNGNRGLYDDLKSIPVEETIRIKADELCRQADNRICRRSNRDLMKYYYLVCAYNVTNTSYNPNELAKAVGIHPNSIQTALCTFTKKTTNNEYIPKYQHKLPSDYIVEQLLHTGLSSDHADDIKELIDEIIEKDDDLEDEQPQVISAAIILYFLELQQIEVPKNFRSDISIPKSTLDNMHKYVKKVHNSL